MQHGFTLVELAIVLVIIGLLVGGVLVGRDLINSAGINAVVSDIQSYQAGAHTFRDKFSGVPGDLRSDKATLAGLAVSVTSPGTAGEGDGDGLLQCGANGMVNTTFTTALCGETTLFWRHLSGAGLIPFTSSATGAVIDTTNFSTGSTEISSLTGVIPAVRINPAVFLHAFGLSGINYFEIALWNGPGATTGRPWAGPSITAAQSYGIDQKMDDGLPATGTILSAAGTPNTAAPANGGAPTVNNTYCYNSTTGAYATIDDTQRCALRIRAGF